MAGLPGPVRVTGDYRRSRSRDAPRVAWLVGRAFATRLPAWIPSIVWSALLLPARMLGGSAVWVLGGAVFVAPATGPIRASVTLEPPPSWSWRVVVRALAVVALLVLVMIPVSFLVGLGVLAAFVGLELALLLADYFLIIRDHPRDGGGGQPSADVTVGQLAAWPMGRGDGSALMSAVLADLDESWPRAVLRLQPANQRLVDLYARLGFRFAPWSGWMVLRCGGEHHLADPPRAR